MPNYIVSIKTNHYILHSLSDIARNNLKRYNVKILKFTLSNFL